MIPTVAVQVAEPLHEHASLMIEACTAALRRGNCELAPADADPPPRAVAVVSWRGPERTEALIEVGASQQEGARWLSQSVDFQPADPIPERWRVVGITIATLVGDLENAEAESQPTNVDEAPGSTHSTAPPGASAPVPERATATESAGDDRRPRAPEDVVGQPAWFGSLGGLVNPGLGSGALRAGAWARVDWIPTPPLLVTLAASFASHPRTDGVALTWLGGSVGSGTYWEFHSVGAATRVELVVERVAVSADQRVPSRALVGGRIEFAAIWPATRRAALTAGLDLTRYSRGVRVRRDGDEVVTFPASAYTAVLGVRVAF